MNETDSEKAIHSTEQLVSALKIATRGLTSIMVANPLSLQGRIAAETLQAVEAELDKALDALAQGRAGEG